MTERDYSRKVRDLTAWSGDLIRPGPAEDNVSGNLRGYDNVLVKDEDSIDDIIERINQLPHHKLWEDNSPLWARPQEENVQMYLPDDYVQVVGHSPVRNIYKEGCVISCDVFSTYRDGRPIGTGVFPIIDTETGRYNVHTWAIGTND